MSLSARYNGIRFDGPHMLRFVLVAGASILICVSVGLILALSNQGTTAGINHATYFPKEALLHIPIEFSAYLKFEGEPSLVAASRDRTLDAYRISCIACEQSRASMLTVRMSLVPLHEAEVATTVTTLSISGPPTVHSRMQQVAPREKVDKFLSLVKKNGFWSMPTAEDQNPPRDGPYRTDGGQWLLEGVRHGDYHTVYRESPTGGPFTELARFLLSIGTTGDRNSKTSRSRR